MQFLSHWDHHGDLLYSFFAAADWNFIQTVTFFRDCLKCSSSEHAKIRPQGHPGRWDRMKCSKFSSTRKGHPWAKGPHEMQQHGLRCDAFDFSFCLWFFPFSICLALFFFLNFPFSFFLFCLAPFFVSRCSGKAKAARPRGESQSAYPRPKCSKRRAMIKSRMPWPGTTAGLDAARHTDKKVTHRQRSPKCSSSMAAKIRPLPHRWGGGAIPAWYIVVY